MAAFDASSASTLQGCAPLSSLSTLFSNPPDSTIHQPILNCSLTGPTCKLLYRDAPRGSIYQIMIVLISLCYSQCLSKLFLDYQYEMIHLQTLHSFFVLKHLHMERLLRKQAQSMTMSCPSSSLSPGRLPSPAEDVLESRLQRRTWPR